MLRRLLVLLALVLIGATVAGIWLWWSATPSSKGEVYVSMDGAPLWNGSGQVRTRLRSLDWGEKLNVLDTYGAEVEVRTPKGAIGWVAGDDLMGPGVWRKLGMLAERVRQMPVQAPAHTQVLSNVRLDPGRKSPRVGQLRPNTPVQVLARGVATWNGGPGGSPRKEDWLLVRAHFPDGSQIAGWVLASFIQENLPEPLPAYASSTGVRPVAWFALRKVKGLRGAPKPNYLMAGTDEQQGGSCDFTMIGVYTWSVRHGRYETAFVRRQLCGLLPIRVKFERDRQKDVLISFRNLGPGIPKKMTFRMRSTSVKQVPSKPSPPMQTGR